MVQLSTLTTLQHALRGSKSKMGRLSKHGLTIRLRGANKS